MPNLNSILSVASGGLDAAQGALQITSNNIANTNTAGYTRELVNLSESGTITEGNQSYGTGVTLSGFSSVRDEVLQSQIYDQTSQSYSTLAQSNALSQAETEFSNTSDNISTSLTSFFNAVSALSTSPSDTTLRQTVVSNAANLASSFHSAASSLSSLQSSLNSTVPKTVASINDLSSQIASLNQQLVSDSKNGKDSGTLKDKQEQLITQLSQLTDVHISQSSDGDTITTGNGTPLVVGSQSFQLSTKVNSSGNEAVTTSNGQDITSTITGGTLGGTISVRDTTIASLQGKLDDLAAEFSSAMNTANASGTDLTGAAGAAMFSVSTSTGNTGAAASIAVTITSGSQIAASSDGTTGSAGNVTNLLAVQNAALPSGMTPVGAYSDLVYTVGTAASDASTSNTAANTALSQLQTQKSSISGVSIDEETTNMIQYQQAYQAAAKIVSTVNSLYTSLFSMVS